MFSLEKLKKIRDFKFESFSYFPIIVLIHDALMAFFSLFLTLYLKIGDEFLNYSSIFLMKNIIVFMLISIGVSIVQETNKAIWKYISIEDLSHLNLSIVISHIIYTPAMFLLASDESFSPFVPLINILVNMFLLNTSRLLVKTIHDQITLKNKKKKSAITIPVLLFGSEDVCETFIRETRYNESMPYEPVGIITLTKTLEEGQEIQHVPVLGDLDQFDNIMKKLKEGTHYPRQILITDSCLKKNETKKILKKCQDMKIIPLKMSEHFSLNPIEEHDSNLELKVTNQIS